MFRYQWIFQINYYLQNRSGLPEKAKWNNRIVWILVGLKSYELDINPRINK